jgi:lipopolysaccharide export system protein LptA
MFTLNPPLLIAALLLTTSGAAAWAEKADRGRPMTLESDQPCTVSLLKQTSVCSGNVVISQGTLQLRADRLELRETPEGYQMAVAIGSAAKPATYRQKRDGADEVVEGQAQRIDYDSRAGTLRFEGAAVVRRLRGGTVADEIQGQQIVWDSTAESFNVRGGAATATNPGGRVRAVIMPRTPADAPAPAPAGSDLKPSPALGDRR